MSVLVDLLPLIWFLAAVGLLILVIRLNRRVSRGARSAGPRQALKPDPVGLTATPWELEAIDLQLTSRSDSPARRDLIATVNRLIVAARDRADLAPLPLSASNHDIEEVVAELETRLDVPSDLRPSGNDSRQPVSPLTGRKGRIG